MSFGRTAMQEQLRNSFNSSGTESDSDLNPDELLFLRQQNEQLSLENTQLASQVSQMQSSEHLLKQTSETLANVRDLLG